MNSSGTSRVECLILIVATLAFGASLCTAGSLKVGVAAVTIDPPTGAPMAGYYHARGSEGVLDNLQAKAAVFDDGKTQVALIGCDLLGMPASVVAQARIEIEKAAGIPGDRVMVWTTHTHTGP